MAIFVEPTCHEFEVPVGGEIVARLEDGLPHSIEIQDDLVVIYDEGVNGDFEIVSLADQSLDRALQLAMTLLHNLRSPDSGLAIQDAIDKHEPETGYFQARAAVFNAFYAGFTGGEVQRPADKAFDACYRSGKEAARLNLLARLSPSFPGIGIGPLDTDTVRSEFKLAADTIHKRMSN